MPKKGVDFPSVSELAQEEKGMETVSSSLIISFILFVTIPMFLVVLVAGKKTFNADVLSTTDVGQPKSYIFGKEIGVTAVVPERLGYKTTDVMENTRSLNIFGNYEKGFRVENIETGETLYEQNNMPGEGVFVQFGKNINYLLHPKE